MKALFISKTKSRTLFTNNKALLKTVTNWVALNTIHCVNEKWMKTNFLSGVITN